MNAPAQVSTLEAPEAMGIRTYVDDMIAANISVARIAVESGIAAARLKAWLAGKPEPDIVPALAAWKADAEAAGALDGEFVMTPTAQRIIRAFDRARQPTGSVYRPGREEIQQRGIALIYGASGVSKTKTAEWYLHQHNASRSLGAWPVVLVRCTGDETSMPKLYGAILKCMEDAGFYRQSHESKLDTIVTHFQEGGLLIFDEAQLLSHKSMDALRIFPDRYSIGLAFMGNLTGYKEFVDAKIAQITSRVGGARVVIDMPSEGDVDAILDRWEIHGRKVRELALMIGMQDGGLRHLANTVSRAKSYAKAKGKPIDEEIFKVAAVSAGAWGGPA